VGVAIAEERAGLATPLQTLHVKNRQDLVDDLTRLIHEYKIAKIVVGLPRTLKGEIGPSAQRVMDQVEWMKSYLPCPCVFWDERLTTHEAERMLLDRGMRHPKRKKVEDQLAAQLILQSYIDYHKENH
jgi:putative Holliday junction resolvase